MKDYTKLLTDLYSKLNPTKIAEIPYLLEKYQGREEELLIKICRKYNVSEQDHPDNQTSDQIVSFSEKISTNLAVKKEETLASGKLLTTDEFPCAFERSAEGEKTVDECQVSNTLSNDNSTYLNESQFPNAFKSDDRQKKNYKKLFRFLGAAICLILLLLFIFYRENYSSELHNDTTNKDSVTNMQAGKQILNEEQENIVTSENVAENRDATKVENSDQISDQQTDEGKTSVDADYQMSEKNAEQEVVSDAASSSTEKDTENKIYIIVDEMPKFMGGNEAMVSYLSRNMQIPREAISKGIQGVVYTTFIIEIDGSITGLRVLKGIGGGCDEEALRIIRAIPNWIPGKQNGQTVRVRFNLPLKFSLPG